MKKWILSIFVAQIIIASICAEHKQLIILLDQSGIHENVTNNYVSLTHELIAALQSNCCPILASVSLWKNIVEKKHEATFAQTQSNAPEYATLQLYNQLSKRIHEISKDLNLHKSMQQKKLQKLITMINNEFYSPQALNNLKKSNTLPSWDGSDAVVMSNFTLDQDSWKVYWMSSHLLLFIPSKLDHGLQLQDLSECKNPLELNKFIFSSFDKNNVSIVESLHKIMPAKNISNHTWTIILDGHGRNYTAAPKRAGKIRYIADLSLQEFKELLNFFDTNITTHLLVSGSCQSSGILWEKIDIMPVSYPILLPCLTDATCTGYVIWPKLPFLYTGLLTQDDFIFDAKQKEFKFYINPLYSYKIFFSEVASIKTFNNAQCQKLIKVLPTIVEPTLNNTPVLLDKNNKFLLYDPQTVIHIADTKPASLTAPTNTVLLESTHFNTTLKCETIAPRIISVYPGKAKHYITKLCMQKGSLDMVIQAFWPLKGLSVDKFFFLDQLECLADKKYSILSASNKHLLLENVLIHTHNDTYMRLYFEYNTKIFSAHARLIAGQPTIKDIHVIRTMSSEQYAQMYKHIGLYKQSKRRTVTAHNRSSRLQKLT